MLILAGVSINLVIGDIGVLTNAQDAVIKTQKATILEDTQSVLVDWQTDYMIDKIPYAEQPQVVQNGVTVSCNGSHIVAVDNKKGTTYVAEIINGEIGEFVDTTTDPVSQVYKATHPTIPSGYTYVTGTWYTGYLIKDGDGNEFVWIPVLSNNNYVKKSGTKNHSFKSSGSVDTDNYDVVSNHIIGDELGLTNILGTPVISTVTDTKTEATIINEAGGFYVSRYEIGIDSAERKAVPTTVTKDSASISIKSKAGLEPLRYVTQEAVLALANSWKPGTNGVQWGLITGTQWNVMCQFIGWSICNSDCESWGNYYNIASKVFAAGEVWHSGPEDADQIGHWYNTAITKTKSNATDARIVFATGKFVSENNQNTMQKNIYDVAGNVQEWTAEVTDRNRRVFRGGSAYHESSNYLATYRFGKDEPTKARWDVCFRVVLYVTPSSAE